MNIISKKRNILQLYSLMVSFKHKQERIVRISGEYQNIQGGNHYDAYKEDPEH